MERAATAAIDEQSVHKAKKIVPGSAFDIPIGAQVLVSHQNLFSDDIATPGRFSRGHAGGLEPPEVLGRIPEPIRVVNSQSFNTALFHQVEQQGVHGLKHLRLLHANGGKLIDVKKAPVVISSAATFQNESRKDCCANNSSRRSKLCGTPFIPLMRIREPSISSRAALLDSMSADNRFRIISFSRCRSRILAGSSSSAGARWDRAVKMLSSSSMSWWPSPNLVLNDSTAGSSTNAQLRGASGSGFWFTLTQNPPFS